MRGNKTQISAEEYEAVCLEIKNNKNKTL